MRSRRPHRARTPARLLVAGGFAGLLAGAAAVTVSELAAALPAGVTSPVLSVANRAVDAAPRPVKEWAIASFGSADKLVLVGGVVGSVAVLAIIIGAVGVRRPRLAAAAFVALTVVSAAAAATDRSASASLLARLLAPAVLLVVGLAALTGMLRAARGRAPATVEGDELPGAFDRRAFLKAALAVSAVAVGGGIAPRALGGSAAAQARAALSIPRPATPAPALPAAARLGVPGITPHVTANRHFYRVDTALRVPDVPVDGLEAANPRDGGPGARPVLRGPAVQAAGRGADHPDLRVQRGRRRVRRQRGLDRGSAPRPAA